MNYLDFFLPDGHDGTARVLTIRGRTSETEKQEPKN